MVRLIRIIKYIFLLFLLIILVATVAALYGKQIKFAYKKFTFSHLGEVAGVSIYDTQEDTIFRLGKGDCNDSISRCYYANERINISYDDFGRIYLIKFSPTSLGVSSKSGPYFITKVEELVDVAGDPDILAISKDFLERRYTYSDNELKNGITYTFIQN